MVPEITDEAIEAFVSFTNASRERAIAFLQHNNGDSHRAINAYFENPNDPLPPVEEILPTPLAHDFHSPTPQNVGGLSAPSRPPSRVGIREKKNVESTTQTPNTLGNPNYSDDMNTDGLTLAEREEHEMQHAITASLGHNIASGEQESGVTAAEGAQFGPANKEYYDTELWALTLPSNVSREISIDPDPELRRRIDDTPRFLRPGPEADHFPAFLTILHSIPIAREELLWRDRVALDYGNDSQWWNGQPALTTLDQAEAPWEDAVHETQRLMAFLDRSQRAFGSADVLSGLPSLKCWGGEDRIATFLKLWEEISPPAEGELPQKTFYSRGVKQALSEDECANEPFSLLDLSIDRTSGKTLYDLLDGHIWCDMPGKELDDIWLEEVAPVFTMRITNHDGNRIDLKVPSVWYPDRYMKHCKEFAVELRKRRVVVDVELEKLGAMVDRYLSKRGSISVDTLVQKVLAGSRVALTGPYQVDGAPSTTQEDVVDLIEKLKTLTEQITHKIQELEERKTQAIESLRQLSNCFTGQASSAEESPRHKYTLRGVCTEPHIFYVLRPRKPELDLMTDDVPDVPATEQWQWWRFSFSVDDAKVGSTRSASLKPSNQIEPSASGPTSSKPVSRATVADNVDIVGYTACPVREIEVLHAAKEESSSVVLVYANEEAMSFEAGELPEPLKNFIDKDNELFEQELAEFTAEYEGKTNTAKQEDLLMEDMTNDGEEETGEKTDVKGQEMQERAGQHSASIMPPPGLPRQRGGAGGQGTLMDQITEENEHDEDTKTDVKQHRQPANYNNYNNCGNNNARELQRIARMETEYTTNTAADTLELLETRLRRIEFLLTGQTNWAGEPEQASEPPASVRETVSARLAELEHGLRRLSARVPAVQDVLKLYSRYPDLFQSASTHTPPATMTPATLASIVLSYATAFPETASRLSSLQDLPIPPASASTALVELQPRIDRALETQRRQAEEIAELRVQSTLLMKRWVEVGVVGGGEVWGEWEERMKMVERGVRREEKARERD
ncbi:TPA_exp: Uncharacterized protein A8136_6478 [Trichophyton benhamiae CBS 112371]|nr:TPA_exp: Uncharacterized protein A8136_6478 [Trichophyton benhamiae CBS 112371]